MSDVIIEKTGWNDPSIARLLNENGLPCSDLSASIDFRCVRTIPGGAVVGIAGTDRRGRYALLRSVSVDADFRRRGYGALLVREMIRTCEAEGVSEIYLLTTTAEAYFRKHGFTTIDRESAPDEIRSTSEFSYACPKSSVCMKKAL